MEDDDLEEMKYMREISKRYEALDEREVTGYKFELNIPGKSNKPKETKAPGLKHYVKEEFKKPIVEEVDNDISKVMGFSGFGRPRAKQFDLEELVKQTAEKARKQHEEKWEKEKGEEESDDDDSIGPQPLPSTSQIQSVDKSKTSVNEEEEDDDDLIGPPLPPEMANTKPADSDDDDDDEEESGSRYDVLPVQMEVELVHGGKSVTALALDPNGSRCMSGGVDYEIRIWDFQGMDSSLQAFRAITPCESHPIKNLEFSTNGDVVLVISGAPIAKVIDRDGFVKGETVKGDQYISDMSNTKGHTAMLNDGSWHPREKDLFITCSNDGTTRVWSYSDLKKQKNVIKPRNQGGLRATPNVCKYTRDGQLITCGCNDGSIQTWDTRRNFVNTASLVRGAHTPGSEISGMNFSYDGKYLASRGTDETLKLWDLRNFKKSLFEANGLFNRFEMTDCFFSPDDKLIGTGVSMEKGEEYGRLMFYNRDTFGLEHELKVTKGSVIRASWHAKLNQIIVGSSNGVVKCYYDQKKSDRGAKLCVVKSKRRYRESYEQIAPQIITPHALPLFKQDRKKSWKVQMMKARKDPVKSKRPELPVTGPGQGGRIASAGNTFASYIAKQIGVRNKIDDNEDPREALLKHAKEASENPYWVSPAYARNQPKPIFADPEPKSDDDDEPEAKRPHVPV